MCRYVLIAFVAVHCLHESSWFLVLSFPKLTPVRGIFVHSKNKRDTMPEADKGESLGTISLLGTKMRAKGAGRLANRYRSPAVRACFLIELMSFICVFIIG